MGLGENFACLVMINNDGFHAELGGVIGFAIYAVGALGYVFATSWELVVGFRVLSGVGAAAVFPMALAYVGRLAPPGAEGTIRRTGLTG